jgi:hypothetical protein
LAWNRFPRSLRADRSARWPSMPQRHRHGYAADLHHGLPASDTNRSRSSPTRPSVRVCTAYQPRSTGFELVIIGGLYTDGSSSTPSDLASRARAVRQYRRVPSLSGRSRPSSRPPDQAAPASPTCCDRPAVEPFHLHSVQQRLVAYDAAESESRRPWPLTRARRARPKRTSASPRGRSASTPQHCIIPARRGYRHPQDQRDRALPAEAARRG